MSFQFPHPPSVETLIAKTSDDDDIKSSLASLAKVRKLLIDGNNDITLDSLLQMADIRSSDYEAALRQTNRGNKIVLKRLQY